jgi:hypothetical protein
MQLAKLVIVTASCLAVRSAAAQPVPPTDGMKTVLPAVLPTATGATLDGRLDYVHLTESDNAPTVFALKLHGQYVAPQGVGGYLSLPVAYVSGEGDSDSESYVGNLELGGLYIFRGANVDAYARVGAALDVGSDALGSFVVSAVSITPYLADAITSGFGTNWLRAGGGARFTSGALVLGGSMGVDVPIGDSELGEIDNLFNISASVGLAQPGFGVAVGITVVEALSDEDNDNIKTLQATGDIEVSPQMRLYGALGANFDNDSEGFSLGAGVRATL